MPEVQSKPSQSPIVFNGLKDVEWRIGVTTSSSEAAQVGQTFVQVKMNVETGIPTSSGSAADSSANSSQTVQVEMTIPKFYAFLSEMEKVKASLAMFK
ncbi:COMM domain-containing protein 7-like [Paramacrobiotus metropolitanus]|uniref:COMM domain-containing protein 7-like n=1 Tax=Paramacrobiotus metropolitanus TaxID=2943436 RepID=UPI002445798F|nr:COMM domain-containing protein 7-like [Paramacrobiotus metropolitanus]